MEEIVTFILCRNYFYRIAVNKGYNVYCGSISSEETAIETAICLDCFRVKGRGIYMDASENVW